MSTCERPAARHAGSGWCEGAVRFSDSAGRALLITLNPVACPPRPGGGLARQRPATCRHPQGRQKGTGRRPNSQRPRQPARNARRAAKGRAWRRADRPTRRREPRTAGRRANVTATVAAGRRGRCPVPPPRQAAQCARDVPPGVLVPDVQKVTLRKLSYFKWLAEGQ